MTDYPSGIDVSLVDGINFDELDKWLEEYATNEIQSFSDEFSVDEKMGNAREEVMPKLVAGGVSAGFFVICLALTCRWRQGLILYVFGAKAAVLALSAIVKIIIQVLVHWQPIDVVNEVVNEAVNEADNKAVNVLQDWRLLKQLLASLGCLTAGSNLIFFYELFQCTCKIELRKLRVRGLIAKMSLVVIASVIVCGILWSNPSDSRGLRICNNPTCT